MPLPLLFFTPPFRFPSHDDYHNTQSSATLFAIIDGRDNSQQHQRPQNCVPILFANISVVNTITHDFVYQQTGESNQASRSQSDYYIAIGELLLLQHLNTTASVDGSPPATICLSMGSIGILNILFRDTVHVSSSRGVKGSEKILLLRRFDRPLLGLGFTVCPSTVGLSVNRSFERFDSYGGFSNRMEAFEPYGGFRTAVLLQASFCTAGTHKMNI
jgi:hypothetical protein